MKTEWIDNDRYENGGCWAICENNGHLVAEMARKGENKIAYRKALKLAAAPDLLEALKFMVDAAKTEPGMAIYKAHIAQAEAAMSKAKGE